jgi:hypothetical protein
MQLEEFVRQQNLELYRKLLAESPADDSGRMMLANEKAEQAARARMRRSK